MRPSSDTMTFKNRSRLIVVGKVNARRLIIPSRASCILILRSKERDCAVLDIVRLATEQLDGWTGRSYGSDSADPLTLCEGIITKPGGTCKAPIQSTRGMVNAQAAGL